MHQRKPAAAAAVAASSILATAPKTADIENGGNRWNEERKQQQQSQIVRKRRRRRRQKPLSRPNHPLLLLLLLIGTALILFLCLWIRLLFQIGRRRNQSTTSTTTTTTTRPTFRLYAENAPVCEPISSPESIDVTLVTQLSDDRLWMMEHHCSRYGPHPISIAVYSNKTYENIAHELTELGCRTLQQQQQVDDNDDENTEIDDDRNQGKPSTTTTNTAAATVTLAVLSKADKTPTKKDDDNNNDEYPVNKLRNLALKGVQTTHIAYVDVDFWPSEGLYEKLIQARRQLWEDPKLAIVLPAFQLQRSKDCLDETIDCRDEHLPRMPYTFQDLKEGVLSHQVTVFDPTNKGGHGSTDYSRWFHHHDPSSSSPEPLLLSPIACLKSHRYEPFLVIRYCDSITPAFQEVFSGYGKNKVTWTMQVAASGFAFWQLGGGAYLIHYPHAISSARQKWNQPETRKRAQIDELYLQFREWLAETIPASNARIRLCESSNNEDDIERLWVSSQRKQEFKEELLLLQQQQHNRS